MNRGLLVKSVREIRTLTILVAVGLFVFEGLLTGILPQMQAQIGDVWSSMPFVRDMLSALLGTEIGDQINAQMLQAIIWVHPVVLTLLWAHEIIICTRFPAGETDRATIDWLLGLPVSRREVFRCESLLWLASGLIVVTSGFAGHMIVSIAIPDDARPALGPSLLTLANLYCLYVAVGGLAFLVSSLSVRRGRAVGAVFAVVVTSFLLNFLAVLWEPAGTVAFLSVLNYYQPSEILGGTPAWSDMVILTGIGAVCWVAAGEIMARRSICTV